MYQQTLIVGNVGRDAELQYTPQGVAVAKFTVAVNKVTGKGETRKEKTTWFNVQVWRERAENASQYIRKGNKIMVIGEVDSRSWIDKKTGEARSSLELVAYDFKFLGDRQQEGDGAGHQQPPADGSNGGDVEDPNDIPF